MRAHRVTVAVLSGLLTGWLSMPLQALCVVVAGESADPTNPVDRTMALMKVAGAVLASHAELTGEALEPKGKLLPASAYSQQLGPELSRWMPTKDAWGRALYVGEDDDLIYVISFGADGRDDVDYRREFGSDDGDLSSTADRASPNLDIILEDDEFIQCPESAEEIARDDVNTIGEALDRYLREHQRYPGPTRGFEAVDGVAPDLPYAVALPRLDPWGRPFWYWSNDSQYVVISAGPDGELDEPYVGEDGFEGISLEGGDDVYRVRTPPYDDNVVDVVDAP